MKPWDPPDLSLTFSPTDQTNTEQKGMYGVVMKWVLWQEDLSPKAMTGMMTIMMMMMMMKPRNSLFILSLWMLMLTSTWSATAVAAPTDVSLAESQLPTASQTESSPGLHSPSAPNETNSAAVVGDDSPTDTQASQTGTLQAADDRPDNDIQPEPPNSGVFVQHEEGDGANSTTTSPLVSSKADEADGDDTVDSSGLENIVKGILDSIADNASSSSLSENSDTLDSNFTSDTLGSGHDGIKTHPTPTAVTSASNPAASSGSNLNTSSSESGRGAVESDTTKAKTDRSDAAAVDYGGVETNPTTTAKDVLSGRADTPETKLTIDIPGSGHGIGGILGGKQATPAAGLRPTDSTVTSAPALIAGNREGWEIPVIIALAALVVFILLVLLVVCLRSRCRQHQDRESLCNVSRGSSKSGTLSAWYHRQPRRTWTSETTEAAVVNRAFSHDPLEPGYFDRSSSPNPSLRRSSEARDSQAISEVDNPSAGLPIQEMVELGNGPLESESGLSNVHQHADSVSADRVFYITEDFRVSQDQNEAQSHADFRDKRNKDMSSVNSALHKGNNIDGGGHEQKPNSRAVPKKPKRKTELTSINSDDSQYSAPSGPRIPSNYPHNKYRPFETAASGVSSNAPRAHELYAHVDIRRKIVSENTDSRGRYGFGSSVTHILGRKPRFEKCMSFDETKMGRAGERQVIFPNPSNSLEWPPLRKAVSSSEDKNKNPDKSDFSNKGSPGENIYKGFLNLSEIGRPSSGDTGYERSATAIPKYINVKNLKRLKLNRNSEYESDKSVDTVQSPVSPAFSRNSETNDPHYDNISGEDIENENNSSATESPAAAHGFSFLGRATDRILTRRENVKRQNGLGVNQVTDAQRLHDLHGAGNDTPLSPVIPTITITSGSNSNYKADSKNEDCSEPHSPSAQGPLSNNAAQMRVSLSDASDDDSFSDKYRRSSAPAMQEAPPHLLNISPAFRRRIFKSISTDGLGGNDLTWRSKDWEDLPEYQRSWSDDFYDLILRTRSNDPAKAEYFKKLVDDRYEALFSKKYPGLKLGSQRRRDDGTYRRISGLDGPQSPRTVKRRAAATRQKRISRDSSPTHSQQSLPGTPTSLEEQKIWSPSCPKDAAEMLHIPGQSQSRFSYDKLNTLNQDSVGDAPSHLTTLLSAPLAANGTDPAYRGYDIEKPDGLPNKSFHRSDGDILDRQFGEVERPCLADGTDGADSDDNHSKPENVAKNVVSPLSHSENADMAANMLIADVTSLSKPLKNELSKGKMEKWESFSNEYASIKTVKPELKQNSEHEDWFVPNHLLRNHDLHVYSEVQGQLVNIKQNNQDSSSSDQTTELNPFGDDKTWLQFSPSEREQVTPEPIYESILSLKECNSRESSTESLHQIDQNRTDSEKFERGNVYDDIHDFQREQKMARHIDQGFLRSVDVYHPEIPPFRSTQANTSIQGRVNESSDTGSKISQVESNLPWNNLSGNMDKAAASNQQPFLRQPRPRSLSIPDSATYRAALPRKPQPVFKVRAAKKWKQQPVTPPSHSFQPFAAKTSKDSPKSVPLKKPRKFSRDANLTQPTGSFEAAPTDASLNNSGLATNFGAETMPPPPNRIRAHSVPSNATKVFSDDSTSNCFRSTASNVLLEHSSTDEEGLGDERSPAGDTNSSAKRRARSAGEIKRSLHTEAYASTRQQHHKISYFHLNGNVLDSLQKSSV